MLQASNFEYYKIEKTNLIHNLMSTVADSIIAPWPCKMLKLLTWLHSSSLDMRY